MAYMKMIATVQLSVRVDDSFSPTGQEMQAEILVENAMRHALAGVSNNQREDCGITAFGKPVVERKEEYL